MVALENSLITSSWHGLYGESWAGLITPESFAHPAKFSRRLISHIYAHAIAEGWLHGEKEIEVTPDILTEIKTELDKRGIPYA
jgi:hypothetical protein